MVTSRVYSMAALIDSFANQAEPYYRLWSLWITATQAPRGTFARQALFPIVWDFLEMVNQFGGQATGSFDGELVRLGLWHE